MIKIENYAKAYNEILKIIEYLPDSELENTTETDWPISGKKR